MSWVTYYFFQDALNEGDLAEAKRLLDVEPDLVYGKPLEIPLVIWADQEGVFDWLLDQGCDPCRWHPKSETSAMNALAENGKTHALERLADRFGVDVLRARDRAGRVRAGPIHNDEKGLVPGVLEICIGRSHADTAIGILHRYPELVSDRPVQDGWRGLDWIEAARDMSVCMRNCFDLTSSKSPGKASVESRAVQSEKLLQVLIRAQAAERARAAVRELQTTRPADRSIERIGHGR